MNNSWISLACDKTNQIVYSCNFNYGIYKSIDNGLSFEIIFNDNLIVEYFYSISCDNTGNFIVCGCNNKKILCSYDGGINFYYLTLENLDNYGILTCCNPDAFSYTHNDKIIFICYSNSGINKYFYSIYYDETNNSFTSFEQNFDKYINNICMNDLYVIIASSELSGFNTYHNKIGYKIIIDDPIREITGIIILSPFSISSCDENFIAIQGINNATAQYEIWKTSIYDLNYQIDKVWLPYPVSSLSLVYDKSLYYVTIIDQQLIKVVFTLNNPWTRTTIYRMDQYPVWLSMISNPYDENISNTIYSGTNKTLYYSYNSGTIFNIPEISCFLENTKIKILKNNVIVDENIENLTIHDEVLISNNETRKISFIGYNFIHKNNLKYIAKIKKNILNINEPNNDLFIMTGHSLLFKKIPNQIKNEHYNESIYNTKVFDNYEKIIALHTNIYEIPIIEELNVINDVIKYFHFALDNDNKNEHYGIYSNNILTETMTLNYVEKSGLYPK